MRLLYESAIVTGRHPVKEVLIESVTGWERLSLRSKTDVTAFGVWAHRLWLDSLWQQSRRRYLR
ncbi:MAG: hypothetical protein ACO2ZD_13395 [Pseudomonadales bacterium]